MGTVALTTGKGSVANGTSSPISPGTPTMNDGDLVFYLIQTNAAGQTLTSGDFTNWTLLAGPSFGGHTALLYARFKDSGWSTIPGSVDISGTSRTAAMCWAMSGFDYTDLSTIVVDTGNYYYNSSAAWPCGGLTLSGLGSDLFILAFGIRAVSATGFTGARTIANTAGYSEIYASYTGTTEFHQLYAVHWIQQSGAASDIADATGDFWNEQDPMTSRASGIRIALKTAAPSSVTITSQPAITKKIDTKVWFTATATE